MARKRPARGKINKKKNSKRKNLPMRDVSAPEYLLFGFILISALLFSFASLQSAKHIQTNFPMTDMSKGKIIFEKRIDSLVSGYPIAKMSPYISRKNKRVASFLVAIAKKESNWGRHTPKKNGRECFNYWGYRGPENTTASGYSCFDSPQHAVNVVGGRLAELVSKKIDTPKEMVIWKCGEASCAQRDRGAAKWIWDVGYYYQKVYSNVKKDGKKQEITMFR